MKGLFGRHINPYIAILVVTIVAGGATLLIVRTITLLTALEIAAL